jgi:hypothetical protein
MQFSITGNYLELFYGFAAKHAQILITVALQRPRRGVSKAIKKAEDRLKFGKVVFPWSMT